MICKNSICDVDGRNKFFSALCEVCAREQEGEIVSPELEAQLRTFRMPSGARIPLSAVEAPKQNDPMVGNALVVGRPQYWYKVVRKMVEKVAVVAAATKKKRYVKQSAQELADEKRHRPLFEGGIEINLHTNKEDK